MIQKFVRACVLTPALAIGLAATAEAHAIVSISPSSVDLAVGDTFSLDILVSDLHPGDFVGGYSLLLMFDDSILEGVDYVNDPDGKMSPGSEVPPVGFRAGTGSPLRLFFAAGAGADLSGQGLGFRLATVTLKAIAAGLSSLTLLEADGTPVLMDPLGDELDSVLIGRGTVCVAGCAATVPEPGLLALFGAGLSAVALRRRSQSHR